MIKWEWCVKNSGHFGWILLMAVGPMNIYSGPRRLVLPHLSRKSCSVALPALLAHLILGVVWHSSTLPPTGWLLFCIVAIEMGVSPFLHFCGMLWEIKNNKNKKGESGEVAGNHNHLVSASCVEHFRMIGFQPSRLGTHPDQERRRRCCHSARAELGWWH